MKINDSYLSPSLFMNKYNFYKYYVKKKGNFRCTQS